VNGAYLLVMSPVTVPLLKLVRRDPTADMRIDQLFFRTIWGFERFAYAEYTTGA
jgi:hypothetical protein